MSFRVIMSPRAEADFRQLFNYIEDYSPLGAERWKAAFNATIKLLEAQPFTCGLAPETSDFLPEEIHQALFHTKSGLTYRAHFVVREMLVHILRVRGPGQSLVDLAELPLSEE